MPNSSLKYNFKVKQIKLQIYMKSEYEFHTDK